MLLEDCSPALSVLSTQICAPEDVALCTQQITLVGHEAVGCTQGIGLCTTKALKMNLLHQKVS